MRSVLCVRSLQCVASAMWTPIGRATSTQLILVFSARFTRLAPDGFHHQARLHGFASTLLLCLPGLHPKLLLQESQEHLCCFRAWMGASSIASPLLLGLGVTRLVLRWRVLACPMTIIQRHRATMRLIESPLSGCRCRGQPSDLAGLAAPFTLETGCGMLAHVAALVFRSLVLAQGVAQHGCRQRELFASFQISVTRSYFEQCV